MANQKHAQSFIAGAYNESEDGFLVSRSELVNYSLAIYLVLTTRFGITYAQALHNCT